MYGIFTYSLLIFMVNVGRYTYRPMDPSWVWIPREQFFQDHLSPSIEFLQPKHRHCALKSVVLTLNIMAGDAEGFHKITINHGRNSWPAVELLDFGYIPSFSRGVRGVMNRRRFSPCKLPAFVTKCQFRSLTSLVVVWEAMGWMNHQTFQVPRTDYSPIQAVWIRLM